MSKNFSVEFNPQKEAYKEMVTNIDEEITTVRIYADEDGQIRVFIIGPGAQIE